MSERARIQISTGVEISNVSTALDEGRDFKKSEFRLLTVCYAAPSNKSNIRLPQFGMISPSTANTCSYESTPISETQFGTPKNISHPAFTNSNLANSLLLIIA